ncbi:MAG: MFS transporter [Candidatus Levybacteria bacterium]|nr:MFS transporter [Candidatus Levybacteria bacterium]
MNKLLPGWNDRTIKYFYLTEAAMNMWFIAPVWFFVFQHFVTVQEIGINEMIAFTIGFLAEVPSGALADAIGRRKTLILGGILLIVGSIATVGAFNLVSLIIAQSIWFIGYAFYSGANEALVYDKLIVDKREHEWAEISARKNSLNVLVITISVLIGGFLYAADYRLPYIVHTGAMILFLICVLRYPKDETLRIINKSVHSFSEYWKNLLLGVKELLRPQLRFLLWGVLAFVTLYYCYEWGVLRPMILDDQGYDGFSASVLSFIVNAGVFALFLILPKLFGENVSEKKVLISVIFASISYTLIALATSIWIAGAIIFVFQLAAQTITWWTSIYINKHVGSSHRATALSAWAMLQKVPYILLVGLITNLSGQAFSLFILISGVIVGLFALGTLALLHKINSTPGVN